MSKEEFNKQWGVQGMPLDKQRLADAAYSAGYSECEQHYRAQSEPVAYIHRNEHNEYRLEPKDDFKIAAFPINVDVDLFAHAMPNSEDIIVGELVKALEDVLNEIEEGTNCYESLDSGDHGGYLGNAINPEGDTCSNAEAVLKRAKSTATPQPTTDISELVKALTDHRDYICDVVGVAINVAGSQNNASEFDYDHIGYMKRLDALIAKHTVKA